MKSGLSRVVLSWPTSLSAPAASSAENPQRTSWMQAAKTGSFVSQRYGKFSITTDDLRTMLANFNTITPKPPTKLPVDFDHLSMDPKRPGDGIAAGWIQKLELRENDSELWALVEWTADAAKRIEAKEYQFVSPSFVKDYVYKDGQKIGTTLLAAAITNHPFLEGMQAVTLLTGGLRDLTVPADAEGATVVVSLMEIGQKVSIKGESGTYAVAEVVGTGDDAFVTLKGPDGERVPGWRRATELGPARLTTDPQMEEATTMTMKNPGGELLQLATTIAKERRLDFRSAVIEAQQQRPDLAQAHREDIVDPVLIDAAAASTRPTVQRPIINLHRQPDEGFVELVGRVQREQRIDLRAAVRIVSEAHPDLVAAYEARVI